MFLRRAYQLSHWPCLSWRLPFDERMVAASTIGKPVDHRSRKAHDRLLGRNVAADKNLPLRLVAASPSGPSLREAEPDAG